MFEAWVIGALAGVVIFQQVFFLRQIQKLVDKLMSRSYTEYIKAENPGPPRVKVAEDPAEDFGVLQNITI